MTKPMMLVVILLGLSCTFLGISGCGGCGGEKEPKKKTTIEKLNSDNPDEQIEGLDEADKQYGGGR